MPYYAPSAYCSLAGPPPPLARPQPQYVPQQQQQYAAPAAPPQVDQVYLRQQAQAQQQAYQQQPQQQYYEQQNRQLAQQQYYQQQQQQQYAQQQYGQQQAYSQQPQYQLASRQKQQPRSSYQQPPAVQQSPARPQYKSSDYVPSGGVYGTGGAYNQPSLRRVPSRADVKTAVENEEAPYQYGQFGQGIAPEQQQRLSQYNPYGNYGQLQQSPLRPQGASQREPSEYAYEPLRAYQQPAQPLSRSYSQEPNLPTAREQPSASNVWIGARAINVPTTVVLDANNNASLPPRSPARGYSPAPQKNYGGQNGTQAESAYIAIPNDLVYAQNNQQRAYTYAAEPSRPAYASSSRTNQTAAAPAAAYKLNPAAARELYAALSSENVRTALERDLPVIQSTPAYFTYNGQRVQGQAFVLPATQKYSEYQFDELNSLRSVIDR